MFDLLLKNFSIITMGIKRPILENSCVGVMGDKIMYIGDYQESFQAKKIIEGKDKVLMPGLVDTHAHAGHGMLKTLGEGCLDEDLLDLYAYIYYQCTTPEFWYLEAQLSALEKIRFGVTTGMSYLGSQPRYDDLRYAEGHVLGMRTSGLRDILGIGTPNPPFPKEFRHWENGKPQERFKKSFESSFETTYQAVKTYHNTNKGLTLCYPTPSYIGHRTALSISQEQKKAKAMKEIALEFGTPIHAHAYKGDVKFAHEYLDILGENLSLSHVTGIEEEEIKILAETGTHVCSGPFTVAYINARCPVVELLKAGVNVAFCTDASAPNRSYDLFEKMRIGVLQHRAFFKNDNLITPGKALEMVTIDAAKAFNLHHEIGSIEVGKKADLICIHMKKPHLYPRWQDPIRLVYEALGSDVDTVIVNGTIIMENNDILTLAQDEILDAVQEEALNMLNRADAIQYAKLPKDLWGSISYKNIKKYIQPK